jgi:hypothetical protein
MSSNQQRDRNDLVTTASRWLEVDDTYRIGVMVDLPQMSGLSDMFPLAVEFALEEAPEGAG